MKMKCFAGLVPILALLFCLAATSVFASDKPQIKIGLIGDSTVANTYGWGPGLADRLKDRSAVINYAKNGARLDSLSKRLDDLIAQKPNYIVIQFGHNDMKRYGTDDYAEKLTGYVHRIKKAGIEPIIFSSVTRRGMTEQGKIKPLIIEGRTLPEYAVAAKGVASKEQVPFVDLNTISIDHHNKVGPKEFATYNYAENDKTHFSQRGTRVISGLVLSELLKIIPGLSKQVAEDKDDWTHLFNGKDLAGWHVSKENPESVYVEDGLLVTHGKRAHLFYGEKGDAVFKDFEMKTDVKCVGKSNSGIFFHTKLQDKGWPGHGFEAQICNGFGDPRKTGSIYSFADIMNDSPAKDDVWINYHLKVQGKNVKIWIDGELVQDWTQPDDWKPKTKRLGSGTIALQAHDPGSKVLFKNMKLREIK